MPRRKREPDPPPKRRARNSGSVGTRRDGRIFAILPADLDPKRRPVYSARKGQPFTSEDEATRWLDAEIARRRNPLPQAARRLETLGSYLAGWYRLYSPGWPPRTAISYQQALRHFRCIGHILLGELTREHIQRAIARMQTATWCHHKRDGTPTSAPHPYASTTIEHARTVLRAALQDLVPEVYPANPVSRTRLGRSQPYEGPVWSTEQARAFLAAAWEGDTGLALALELIVRRALRRGEVLALRWPDVDERRCLLTVDETQGLRRATMGDVKGRRVREIPLSPMLLAKLKAHRKRQDRLTPWVFDHGGAPWSRDTIRRAAVAAMEKAGLPKLAIKDLRATCATVALEEGVSLPVVSRLLGHASVDITARRYARYVSGQIVVAGDRIDTALDASRDTSAVKQESDQR